MYIACLCPNLVSVNFMQFLYYTSNFLNFLFTCIHSTTVLWDMYMYCIERSGNISSTRITRVNNICFCYVAISDDISTHANFQVDGYHGC